MYEDGSETVTLSLGNLLSPDGSESNVLVNISDTATLTIIDDEIGLSVTSVGYFADAAASLTITQAALGAHIYLVVEFSENVENVNTDFPAGVPGQPRIDVRVVSLFPGRSTQLDPIRVVTAYNTALTINACRAESESNTSKYLCRYTVQAQGSTGPGPLRVEVKAGNVHTKDGNTLAMDYEDVNSVEVKNPPRGTDRDFHQALLGCRRP